ncbi:FAD-dependent oxidoreductase, partial [Autumnicola edwardsiae]
IATGAKPRVLDFEGGNLALSSTEFLNLKKLPKSLLCIGGGYIAFEFAHIAARAGADVTILHRGEFPLENFDRDILQHLVDATRKLGIKLVLKTDVSKIEKKEGHYVVTGKSDGKESAYKTASVFNS